jgi:hypothetical protein
MFASDDFFFFPHHVDVELVPIEYVVVVGILNPPPPFFLVHVFLPN